MKLSVCMDSIYRNRDMAEGLKEIREAGFTAFEFWTWWDKDLHRIREVQQDLGMETVTFCTRFLPLNDGEQRIDYIQGVRESLEAAQILGCKRLITQVGNDMGTPRARQVENIIAGLHACVPFLEAVGVTLMIEPLNTRVDHPGYFLTSADEAFSIVDAVGSPWVKVLYDIYHQQLTEGDLLSRILPNIEKIGHFHAAGVPGRAELDRSEIHYPFILNEIVKVGYCGHFGLEYFPKEEPLAGLKNLDLAMRPAP